MGSEAAIPLHPLRLRTWLVLGYGAVLALSVLGLGLGLLTVRALETTAQTMAERDFPTLQRISDLRRAAAAHQITITHRLIRNDQDPGELMPAFRASMDELLGAIAALDSGDEPLASITLIRLSLDEIENAVEEASQLFRLGLQDATVEARVTRSFDALRMAAYDDYQSLHQRMIERGHGVHLQARRLEIALALLAAFTLVGGIFVSLHLARRLAAPLEGLAEAASRVATGDFGVRLGRTGLVEGDQLAERFDEMVAALQRFHALNLDRILAERSRLEQVIEQIDDGLVIFDENGVIERINHVAALQLGLDADHALGRTVQDITDIPALASDIERLSQAPFGAVTGHSDLLVKSEPEQRTLSYSLLPFSAAARRGLVLVLRDVTEQRRFERMRTEFVLRASHELRTPVTGMHMALALLRERAMFPPESREQALMQTLGEEMDRTVALINSLLDLSRLYADSFPLVREPVAPDELMTRAQQRFAQRAAAAGIELELRLEPPLPPVPLDAAAIDQVLDNLLSNALRHTPRGGRVELGARHGGMLTLWVADTGEGIPPAEQGRVFEPFTQGSGRVGSSGLGLALCREILHRHGGRIRLTSTPGQGARFVLRLPA